MMSMKPILTEQLGSRISSLKFVVGSLMLGGGWTIASVHALEKNFFPVFFYLLVMFTGFKVARDGVHGNKTLMKISQIEKTLFVDGLLVIAGLAIFSHGYQLFFSGILLSSITVTVKPGAYLIIGYAVSHAGLTNAVW